MQVKWTLCPAPRVLVAIRVVRAALAVGAWLAASSAAGAATSQPAPVLGVTVDPAMRVVDVERGSPADQAGVHRGDRLIALDTIKLTEPGTSVKAKRYMGATHDGQALQLILARAGRRVELLVESTPFKGHPGQVAPTPVVDPHYFF